MEEHLTVVEGINLEQEVNNYPLPFETAEEGRFMARIISTRRVELYNFSLLKVCRLRVVAGPCVF